MNIALTLLMTAMSLLTQVSHSPNATPALRNEANTIANQAIVFAESVLNEPVTPVPVSTPINPIPADPIQVSTQPLVFGSTQDIIPTSACTVVPQFTLSTSTGINPQNSNSIEVIHATYTNSCTIPPASYTHPISWNILDSQGNPIYDGVTGTSNNSGQEVTVQASIDDPVPTGASLYISVGTDSDTLSL